MADMEQVKSDLGYLREVVRTSEQDPSLSVIYFLWAALCLVGFSLVDFAPRHVGLYWSIAAPLGFLTSCFLGWRHSRRQGQMHRDLGIRYGLHMFGMMVVIFLAAILGVIGAVCWQELSKLILLIIGLSYFLAGLHLERPLLWIGILMMVGYLALFVIPAYGWTFIGALVAVALVSTGLIGRRKSGTSPR
ncbi:MAG: hypothetical protein AAGB97_05905 [Dehalococcoidia bacterium]|nr:hypothetical protein [Chloroflexota bacterium]MBT9162263.1 hypothetical protein [Chloroflexota bacterium]